MSNRKFIWAFLLIATILLFYSWLPSSFYNTAPTIISIIGGALFTFLLVQVIADFDSWEEFNTKEKELQDWRHKYTPFLIIPVIIMAVVFGVHFSSRETAELKKYGVKVTGTIIDGSGRTNLRGNGTYDVIVEFYTKEGQLYHVKEDVSKEDFNSLGKGQEVELLYSTKNPRLIELFTSDYNIEKCSGVKDREILPDDLIRFISIEKDSIANELNKISYQWVSNGDSSWLNERKKSLVTLGTKDRVLYITFNDAFHTYPNKLKGAGFHEDSTKNKKMRVFESKDFLAAVELRVGESMSVATVVTLERK